MNMVVNLPVIVRLSDRFVYKKLVKYTHLSDENVSDEDNDLLSGNSGSEISRQQEFGSQGANENNGFVATQAKEASSAVVREVSQSPASYKTKIV
jgi:hypothetical protein